MSKLNENFVAELLKICLSDKRVMELSLKHVKYSYLPGEESKEVWKSMSNYYEAVGESISIGILAQQFSTNAKVVDYVNEIKKTRTPAKDSLLEQLEIFIKDSMFVEAYDKMGDSFNSNDKDAVFDIVSGLGDKLTNFTIKDSYYDKIFEGFQNRHEERQLNADTKKNTSLKKVPSGIDELDRIMRGGFNETDTALFLAQSGVGKTKLLRWLGVAAARRGYKVLHIQAEGSRDECLEGYDATFTGIALQDIEWGKIEPEKYVKVEKAIKNVNYGGGEIYVESFEQFDTATMADVRHIFQSVEKAHGHIDMVLIDYLELLDPGDGKKYNTSNEGERKRREAVGNKMKNLAVEGKTRVISCTQASTVAPDLLNDNEFVQTRYNISEFKGIIKPFSIFITLNQTGDEYSNGTMRLYVDKLRKYRGGQLIKLYQNYGRERFYDRMKTLKHFYSEAA